MSFERALERALALPREHGTIVCVSGETDLDPEALMGRAGVVWDSRERPELSPELMVGIGVTAEITDPDRAEALFERIAVHGGEEPRLFGGFAFDPRALGAFEPFGRARFVLPRWSVTHAAGVTRLTLAVSAEELERPNELVREASSLGDAEPERGERPVRVTNDGSAAFLRATREALEAIARCELDKVVVVRQLELAASFSQKKALSALSGEPLAVRFCFSAAGRTFLGATPELLFAYDGHEVVSEAVAGTAARSGAEAHELERFVASDKDAREHAYVARFVRRALEATGAELGPETAPSPRAFRHLYHLVTPIRAKLANARALDLVRALHPTPAVSGTPRDTAERWLRRHEAEARGWFAGPVGFIDAKGRGAFVVALRSALIEPDTTRVYAGAGIVRGSDPERELAETELKLRTMLGALGVRRERLAREEANLGGAP